MTSRSRLPESIPSLDAHVVTQLREVMEYDFVDLLQTYLVSVPNELNRLTAAMASRDVEGIVGSSHAVKGSSANIGALRLSALCKVLEQMGREKRIDSDADTLLQAIFDEFSRVKPLIEQWSRNGA